MVDFSIDERNGMLVPIEKGTICQNPVKRVVEVRGILMPLCEKHAELEWLFLAALDEKAVPDA